MVAITFDTLAFIKKLQDSGMPQSQAEALANAQKLALEEMVATQELVTKNDLHIALAEIKYSLLKWQLGIGFALVVIMAKGFGWLGF